MNHLRASHFCFVASLALVGCGADARHRRRADLVLLGGSSGATLSMLTATTYGTFGMTTDAGGELFQTFSRQSSPKSAVGDFNGDGRNDIALVGGVDPTNGQIWGSLPIAYAVAGGTFGVQNNLSGAFTRYARLDGARLFVGRFNRDAKSDLVLSSGTGWNTIPTALAR